MAIHTATAEASRVYSIRENTIADGCFLRGGAASCLVFCSTLITAYVKNIGPTGPTGDQFMVRVRFRFRVTVSAKWGGWSRVKWGYWYLHTRC